MAAVRAAIDESVRVEPTIMRVLDSIPPNKHSTFQTKVGREIVLMIDYFNMSLCGIDESSYTTNWSWAPQDSKIRFAAIAGVRMTGEGVGECLVADLEHASDLYRYTFKNGRTSDSSLLQLPKPAHLRIGSIDVKGSLIAFTTPVNTLTVDTLFAYVMDTVTGWHSEWKMQVTNDDDRLMGSTILFMDTTVVVLWREVESGMNYRYRIMVRGIYSEDELKAMVLSDADEFIYDVQFVGADETDGSVVIIAQATSRVEPRWGLQIWRYNVGSDELESVVEFLPKYTYPTVYGAMISNDGGVTAVGKILDYDPAANELIESSSRGFICEFDSALKIKQFLSMQDQRPSRLSSLYKDQNKLYVLGQGADQASFIARIDEDRITSVDSSKPGNHEALQHIGWYDVLGRSLQSPGNGAVVELLQCSSGCYHSRLLLVH
ncbi:MAG: hypothetical protein QY319_02600 [Candidatus Kapaibacterium sp.]|nr:hypothetical protein [Candidatus Kapabacteria bacterium]WKZ78315.1 MAG: hypothetical protein QY319_02600 [Candidatus Kapabacteria bacterium]